MSGSTAVVGMLLLGLFAGVMSGMFGIGGGLIIVPALVIVFGLSQKTATGTSLLALLLPVGLLAVIGFYREGQVKVGYGLLIAAGIFLGAYLGQRITTTVSDMTLKRIYAGFLVIVAGYYVLISSERGRAWLYGPAASPPSAKTRN